ncbi:MAG: hypothetical protein QOF37_1853, partial [Thermoleophilaceae bacterium]|nr:hypothetical protein [Thermoleophilaceae bacterium]
MIDRYNGRIVSRPRDEKPAGITRRQAVVGATATGVAAALPGSTAEAARRHRTPASRRRADVVVVGAGLSGLA